MFSNSFAIVNNQVSYVKPQYRYGLSLFVFVHFSPIASVSSVTMEWSSRQSNKRGAAMVLLNEKLRKGGDVMVSYSTNQITSLLEPYKIWLTITFENNSYLSIVLR